MHFRTLSFVAVVFIVDHFCLPITLFFKGFNYTLHTNHATQNPIKTLKGIIDINKVDVWSSKNFISTQKFSSHTTPNILLILRWPASWFVTINTCLCGRLSLIYTVLLRCVRHTALWYSGLCALKHCQRSSSGFSGSGWHLTLHVWLIILQFDTNIIRLK